MNRCRDCRHWDRDGKHADWLPRRGIPPDHRNCERSLGAIAYGEGVIQEGIATAPDFGCVEFEPRA